VHGGLGGIGGLKVDRTGQAGDGKFFFAVGEILVTKAFDKQFHFRARVRVTNGVKFDVTAGLDLHQVSVTDEIAHGRGGLKKGVVIAHGELILTLHGLTRAL